MGERIARHDWAATPLGPLSAWPASLRIAVGMIVRSPIAMSLMCGEEGVMIYNDAFVRAAARHGLPSLGAKVRDSWPEVAGFNDHVMRVVLGGETLSYRDHELCLERPGQAEKVWFDLDYSPVVDESGEPIAVLAVAVETTGRVLAERSAVAQVDRQRRLFEEAPGFVCILSGRDYVIDFINAAFRRLLGDRDVVGKPLYAAYPDLTPDDAPSTLDRVYETGEPYFARSARVPVRREPGGRKEERFLDFVIQPIIGEGGQVTGLFVEGFDVTDSVLAQAAVQESERRLSAAIAIARLGTFEWDLEKLEATLDARAREIFGFSADEPLKLGEVLGRIDPEDALRLSAENAAAAATRRSRREFEYRVRLPDGSARHVAALSDSLLSHDGRQVRIIGVFADVTERRRAEDRQQLLINELNHRVKNTLATVQSIAGQTLRTAPDLLSARDAFEARLVALAAAHDLLTAQSWRGARLTDVVAQALAPFESQARPQFKRSGPPVWLSAQRAVALSLALHELATNAVKYGALSTPEGEVEIEWARVDGHLVISWVEHGGPPVPPPRRSGFGARLLQRGLARELHGDVTLTFAPEGVRCIIRCDLQPARLQHAPETAGF